MNCDSLGVKYKGSYFYSPSVISWCNYYTKTYICCVSQVQYKQTGAYKWGVALRGDQFREKRSLALFTPNKTHQQHKKHVVFGAILINEWTHLTSITFRYNPIVTYSILHRG